MKRFYLGTLLGRMDGHTCGKTEVTNTHEINDTEVDNDADLIGVSGFITSVDGLKDVFNATVELTDVTQKDALLKATPEAPVECTTAIVDTSETGFIQVTVNVVAADTTVEATEATDTATETTETTATDTASA